MKPSTTLISALRRAADRIEAPDSHYNWSSCNRCNCGILAHCLIGEDQTKVATDLFKHVWALEAEAVVCGVTGRPVTELFSSLFEFGLEVADFSSLEHLNNPELRQRAGLGVGCVDLEDSAYLGFDTFQDKSNGPSVARYFRAQADLLEEQLHQPPPPQQVKQAQHECCHMWLECGVCMICSATKPVVLVEVGCD